jgi:hypothetical protein
MRFGKESRFTLCLVFWLPKQSNYFDVRTMFLNSFNDESFPLGHGPVPELLGFQSFESWQLCQLQMSSDAAPYFSHTAVQVVTFCCMPPAAT